MKLSVVATLYHSEAYISEFYRRITLVAQQFTFDEDYEVILVNDGSPDNSLGIAVQLTESDSHVVVVDLSRNFGHHRAMMTGLSHAQGELIFLIDSDLEEEPEWLFSFAEQMKQDNNDVVYGVQNRRKGGFFEKITGWFFFKVFRLFTGVDQPNNIVTARLMTRRYVSALLMHQEREVNIGGLWIITGFKQGYQAIKKYNNSPTSYSLVKKISHFFNAITSFSSLPLVMTFYSGLVLSTTSLFYIVSLILRYMTTSTIPSGYTSMIASIWFFSGVIIFFLGVQGLYISKIFSEVKQRPYTIIRHVYRQLLKEEYEQ